LPDLPSDLREDFARFEEEVLPWLEPDPLQSAGQSSPAARARLDRLRAYGALLHERAARLSLIAKGDRESIFTRHVLDSLNPLALFEQPPASFLDVGSGAGLPGIPLAIMWPEARAVLLESRDRKAGFLEHATRTLGLSNVCVVCARLEDYGQSWKAAPAAAVFIRAVGDLPRLLPAIQPAAEEGAHWIHFLGDRSQEEAMPASAGYPAMVQSGTFHGRLLTGRFPGAPR
jgi:16S rRNA (guanine527-N7)-methyltransferase